MANNIPLTYVNGHGPLTDWIYNGTDLQFAYMNGKRVFEKALRLKLPCNPTTYTELNLRQFIDSKNTYHVHVIIVELESGCRHPTIRTGDLSNLFVTLIINGSLEAGTLSSAAALIIESSLTVINNGYIRGRGGKGGKGGKGADGESTTSSGWGNAITRYDGINGTGTQWTNNCQCCVHAAGYNLRIDWHSDGSTFVYGANFLDAGSCPNYAGPYYKDKYRYTRGNCRRDCGTANKCHEIIREEQVDFNEDGGAGGAGGDGGHGQYYRNPAEIGDPGQEGQDGSNPPKTKGYYGGAGGKGGDWGEFGHKGFPGKPSVPPAEDGHNGSGPGAAIIGESRLNSGSDLKKGQLHPDGSKYVAGPVY